MTSRTRLSHTMVALAATMLLTSIASVGTALGQPFFANPPCPNVKVTNLNNCTATLTFATIPPGAWPATFNVPPGGSFGLPNPAPGVTVIGFFDSFFAFQTLNPPPSPGLTGCGPTTGWWRTGVTLGPPAAGCVFNICVDPGTCNITLY